MKQQSVIFLLFLSLLILIILTPKIFKASKSQISRNDPKSSESARSCIKWNCINESRYDYTQYLPSDDDQIFGEDQFRRKNVKLNKKSADFLILVMSSYETASMVLAIENSWAKLCNQSNIDLKYVFPSVQSQDSDSYEYIAKKLLDFANVSSRFSEMTQPDRSRVILNGGNMNRKSLNGVRPAFQVFDQQSKLLKDNNVNWIMKINDDSYVFPKNLISSIRPLNPSQFHVIIPNNQKNDQSTEASGYILSYGLSLDMLKRNLYQTCSTLSQSSRSTQYSMISCIKHYYQFNDDNNIAIVNGSVRIHYMQGFQEENIMNTAEGFNSIASETRPVSYRNLSFNDMLVYNHLLNLK